ncbi:MAG: hypothetical protein ABI443_09960 [Chthoniobacterales bacterium]
MQFIFPLALGLMSMAFLRSPSVCDIPLDHQAVFSGQWSPAAEDIKEGFVEIQKFLDNPKGVDGWDRLDINKICGNAKNYRVQLRGIIHDGKKHILYNFVMPHYIKDEEWRTTWSTFKLGGHDFWRIEYNPATKACEFFETNPDR